MLVVSRLTEVNRDRSRRRQGLTFDVVCCFQSLLFTDVSVRNIEVNETSYFLFVNYEFVLQLGGITSCS